LPGAYSQFEKWLELDPQDANAVNHLLSASIEMREFKKAAKFIKMHDAVAPPEAWNLSLQARMYAMMGQLDKAMAKSKQSLEIQPDFRFSLELLILLYAVNEEYEESMRWANEYVSRASSAGLKSEAYCRRGFYLCWRGNFKDALNDFALADKMAEEAENWEFKANALEGKGIVFMASSEFELSRKSFEDEAKILVERLQTFVPFSKAYMAWRMGMLAVEQGQISSASAKLSEIRSVLPEIDNKHKSLVTVLSDLLQGEALLTQGAFDAALAAGQKACGPGSPYWSPQYSWPFQEYTSYYMDLSARVYAKKGDIAKATSEYERLLKLAVSGSAPYFVNPLYHYRLGILYERAGEPMKAKAQYQRFLDLWKAADPGQPEVDDARKRLAGLKST
jgi:tetratricopeptide (TPR) repeat protein